ncbi:MAG: hypothetical protein AAGA57_06815 [Planctomycetota bacterium]
MSETLLVLPLLLVIFSLMFFLGLNIKRLERATMLGRYEARRQASTADGPIYGQPEDREAVRTLFFESSRKITVSVENENEFVLGEPLEEAWRAALVDAQGARASEVLDEYVELLPRGRFVRVRVDTDDRVPLWRELTSGRLEHATSMVGSQWRFADALGPEGNEYGGVYRRSPEYDGPYEREMFAPSMLGDSWLEVYAPAFRDALDPFVESGNVYAAAVSNWLIGSPGYFGPDLPLREN